MCWVSYKSPKAKVAKRDIKVLKVLYGESKDSTTLIPYFYGRKCSYTLNEESTLVPIKVEYGDFIDNRWYTKKKAAIIRKGYHAYGLNSTYEILNGGIYINNMCWFNSYLYLKMNVYLVECIIPKGTKYFLNGYKEYVSEKIKPLRIITS